MHIGVCVLVHVGFCVFMHVAVCMLVCLLICTYCSTCVEHLLLVNVCMCLHVVA